MINSIGKIEFGMPIRQTGGSMSDQGLKLQILRPSGYVQFIVKVRGLGKNVQEIESLKKRETRTQNPSKFHNLKGN